MEVRKWGPLTIVQKCSHGCDRSKAWDISWYYPKRGFCTPLQCVQFSWKPIQCGKCDAMWPFCTMVRPHMWTTCPSQFSHWWCRKQSNVYTHSCSLVRKCHRFSNEICTKLKIMDSEDNTSISKTILPVMLFVKPCHWSTWPIMAMNYILHKRKNKLNWHLS